MSEKTKAYDLNQEFPSTSYQDWRALVETELKGADFEKRYVAQRADGLRIEPLYSSDHARPLELVGAPGAFPHVRGVSPVGGWRICARYERDESPTPGSSRAAEIREDLERGVEALWLAAADLAADPWPAVFAALPSPAPAIFVDPSAEAASDRSSLPARLVELGLSAGELVGGAGGDPYARALVEGADGLERALEGLPRQVRASSSFPGWSPVVLSSEAYFEREATPVHELSYLIAAAIDLLRRVHRSGGDSGALAAKLVLRVAVGDEVYLEIAKVRALRLLWSRMLELFELGGAAGALRLHVVSGRRSLTRVDRHVNMLRQTSVAFIGATCGADWVTTLPFDAALGAADPLARRMALNTQLILRDESYLDRVADPAGGSYYIESLTRELAESAWRGLQELEAGGGIVAALHSGAVAETVDGQRRNVSKAVATRRLPLVGTSEFPNIGESPIELQADPVAGAALRRAVPFETLRARADAHLAHHGRRPTVFMANLGPIPTHKARSTFAENFFWSGGFQTHQNDGFVDVESCVAAFGASSADGAVLCSSDEVYAERAVETAHALRRAGARFVAFAGRPGALEEELRAVPIDAYLFLGSDAVVTLSALLDLLGVQR